MTKLENRITHSDLLIILARARHYTYDEEGPILNNVREICKRFQETIPEIVEKLGLKEHE